MAKEALDTLIDAVETESLPEAIFHGSSSIRGHWAYVTGLSSDQRRLVFLAYNGDINAAKALHGALLPGWRVHILEKSDHFAIGVAEDGIWHAAIRSTNPDIARGWLLAILYAYRVHHKRS